MKRFLLFAAGAAAVITAIAPSTRAGEPRRAARQAAYFASARPWHGDYAYTPYGEPVALVVPPTADTISSYGWGVAQTEIRPIWHQFGRADPGGAVSRSGNPWLPTPNWPSHTDQFGVYAVRGPWR